MTKDEAVKKIAREGYISIEHAEELYDEIIPKPVVPKYVADYIEKVKSDGTFSVVGAILEAPDGDVQDWLFAESVDTFVQAWVNGYNVEKEPRYKVTFKGLNINKHLCCNWTRENWYLWCEKESNTRYTSHTRKELEEADFGWVFDCEGIEIEEVE
ncbi:ORF19 [Streptococcus phage 01205]|uniref:ORF19 n=1 Tax=Streptococcus phage O1205 TaxID=85154 RepID=O34050_BPO12|nr:ORF19 [Streptococcus phage 01205]AAC79535.1 ORF19 [Streptococcus phage 01205]